MFKPVLVSFFALTFCAYAETAVKARYEITVSGFRVGIAGLEGSFSENDYQAALSVKLSGVAKMIASGAGSASVEGKLINGRASPASYTLNLDTGDKQENIAMNFSGNALRSLSAEPTKPPMQGTVPVSAAHKMNILDPFSAGLFTSNEASEKLGSDACNKAFPIFDGRQRYDMTFSYSRKETIKAIGYKGEAVVCKARYIPISGHVANRPDVQFLANNKNMEVMLVPVRGTKTFIPARISIETPMGLAVIDPIKLDLGVSQQAQAQ